jgi:tetratricopeptide (TPR) repeat protein
MRADPPIRKLIGFLKSRWVLLAATVAVAVGAVVDLEAQYEPPGREHVQAAIAVAAVAVAIFLLTQVLLPTTAKTPGSGDDKGGSHPVPPVTAVIVPEMLPERLATFVGGREVLDELTCRHADARADTSRQGPLKLLIHGIIGVGKSALAVELAHTLAPSYPDGQLFAQMGTASRRRNPGEILGEFLRQLGREDLPKATEDRIKLFRSLTAGKDMLIVLDGARDEDQVNDVLPSESRCTLIITSRRNLGPELDERPFWLDIPSALDAAEIIRRYLPPHDETAADILAEVADMCGRIPMALRSAGERARKVNGGLGRVARLIKSPTRRLPILAESGRDLGSRIAIVYDRLLDRERKAMAMLTLVKTRTFVPWVLQPLLDIGPDEASTTMTSLRSAGLVHVTAAPDYPRYELNPLVRLFAASRRAGDVSDTEAVDALDRLQRASLACAARVIQVLDRVPFHDLVNSVDDRWLPDLPQWEQRLADSAAFWITAEFGNLVDAVILADKTQQYDICWRLAWRFGECVSTLVDFTQVDQAFQRALEATQVNGGSAAAIRVRLAYGSHLIAIGRYDLAFEVLEESAKRASSADDRRSLASAHRIMGHTWQRLGDYRRATAKLNEAVDRLPADSDNAEAHFTNVLRAENQAVTVAANWCDDIEAAAVRQGSDYQRPPVHVLISYADAAARRRSWDEAEALLDRASAISHGDEGFCAYAEYKRAAILVQRASADGADRKTFADQAIGHASQAVAWYRNIGSPDGESRARAVLASAYLLTDRPGQFRNQIGQVWNYVNALPETEYQYLRPLCGQLHWLEGMEKLHQQQGDLAVAELDKAITIFADCGDCWREACARMALGKAHRLRGQTSRSLACLYGALTIFEEAHDAELRVEAAHEIGETRKLET